jgi:hypothetical protein
MTEAMRTASASRLKGDPASASTADVLAAQRSAVAAADRFGDTSGLAFGPIFGMHPLPSSIEDALRLTAPDVELLIGFAKDDAAPFVAMNPQMSRLQKLGPFGKVVARRVTRHVTAKLFGDQSKPLAACGERLAGRRPRTDSTGDPTVLRSEPATASTCRSCSAATGVMPRCSQGGPCQKALPRTYDTHGQASPDQEWTPFTPRRCASLLQAGLPHEVRAALVPSRMLSRRVTATMRTAACFGLPLRRPH